MKNATVEINFQFEFNIQNQYRRAKDQMRTVYSLKKPRCQWYWHEKNWELHSNVASNLKHLKRLFAIN